jgi:2-polyprenyl-6-methoxyphenol hydroxylase-like FAD-dependent oxidoreductase
MRETEVLIVGGGPVGLTASILLSRAGVGSTLVERHPGTSIHPKARHQRTMEIFHQCGVEDAVRAAGLPPERALHRRSAACGENPTLDLSAAASCYWPVTTVAHGATARVQPPLPGASRSKPSR